MQRFGTVSVGICANGPVTLSEATQPDWKFVISICRFSRNKPHPLLACKTTSKNHDKLWPGEFMIDDFFKRGKSKVQPYNIVRIPPEELLVFKYIGKLEDVQLPDFEPGIKIAIKKGLFSPLELLNVIDAWEPFFKLA